MIARRHRREYRPHRAVFACAACGDTARFWGLDRNLVVFCLRCAGTFANVMTDGVDPRASEAGR